MHDLKRASGLLRRQGAALIVVLLLASGVVLYFEGLRHNPPGFHLDESSIAYNAHTISQTGRGEYGEPWHKAGTKLRKQNGYDVVLLDTAGRITLDVFEENRSARAFYEKHGFQARDRWMNEEEGAIDLLYVRE